MSFAQTASKGADAEGWLYLAIVVDLFSRKIVGWAMSDRMKRGLAMAALQRAITLRRPPPGLIHHSDRGSQYYCGDYRRLVDGTGFIASMSGRAQRLHPPPRLAGSDGDGA